MIKLLANRCVFPFRSSLWLGAALVALCSDLSAQSNPDSFRDFFDALASADSQGVIQFLQNPDNVSATDAGGDTPLHAAVRRGNRFAVELLLAYGADTETPNNDQLTPLELLIDEPDLGSETLRRSIAQEFVRFRLRPSPTGAQRRADLQFRLALRARDEALARAAVANGADPNAGIDGFDNTVLHDEIWPNMAPLVIELGGDPGHLNALGDTPLRSAFKRGDVRVSAALLEAGSALSDRPELPDLLLVIRSRSDNTDMLVELLLDAGAAVGQDEWLAAMSTRNGNLVRRLWRFSPFDPASDEGEELLAEAVRLGGPSVMAALRRDPELAAYIDQREGALQRNRDGDARRFLGWLAPHSFAILGLALAFSLLSCAPAALLLKGRKAFVLSVGASAAVLTHLFVFTPVIDAGLAEFRFFGERVPSLRYATFAFVGGLALAIGLLVGALAGRPISGWVRTPSRASIMVALYVATLGVLIAHNTQTIAWPTALYQKATGYENYVARIEQRETAERNERAAGREAANLRAASAPHAALFRALQDNDSAAVIAELERGIPVDIRNERGETALFVAASDGRLADMVTTLLAAGADPNALHDGGRRPVHALAANGIGPEDPESMRRLIQAGADINARTDMGQTPLCSAHRRQHDAASRAYFDWLLANGADIKYSDSCATEVYSENPEFFLPLLQGTADDVDQRRPFAELNDPFGAYRASALWRAAYRSSVDDVTLLIALGADIESRDTKRGMTPLQIAVEHSQYDSDRAIRLVELLQAAGADTEAVAWDGSRLIGCEQQCRVQSIGSRAY